MSNKDALYVIKTKMDKEDFRSFSYITIFSKKYLTVFLIVLLAAVCAAFYIVFEGKFEVLRFLLAWIILIAVAFAAVFLSAEYRNIKKINAIRAGLGKQPRQIITFFDHYLVAEDENAHRSHKIKYDNLYKIIESKNYFVIYANKNAASMIRKIDIDPEYREEFGTFIKARLKERYKKF